MKILTVFDRRLIEDGWRHRIEQSFSILPGAEFSHTESVTEAVSLLKRREPRIVIFGSFGGREGGYLLLAPYIKPRHVPILLSGDLEIAGYKETFRQRTGRTLEHLDTVRYYDYVKPILETIGSMNAGKTGESRG